MENICYLPSFLHFLKCGNSAGCGKMWEKSAGCGVRPHSAGCVWSLLYTVQCKGALKQYRDVHFYLNMYVCRFAIIRSAIVRDATVQGATVRGANIRTQAKSMGIGKVHIYQNNECRRRVLYTDKKSTFQQTRICLEFRCLLRCTWENILRSNLLNIVHTILGSENHS